MRVDFMSTIILQEQHFGEWILDFDLLQCSGVHMQQQKQRDRSVIIRLISAINAARAITLFAQFFRTK